MQLGIAELVGLRGGRLFHVRDARRSPELEDLPDLIVIAPPLLGLWELKSATRRITRGQLQVAELLARCDRLSTGIVRSVPRPGELGYDEALDLLRGGHH